VSSLDKKTNPKSHRRGLTFVERRPPSPQKTVDTTDRYEVFLVKGKVFLGTGEKSE
jgi:hypothetical protein